MGSAVSVVNDEAAMAGIVAAMPPGLKEIYELTERQKLKIAELDAAMLEAETAKLFKGHNKVIDELTARSKSQLRFLFDKYPATVKQIEGLVMGGNPYAKFIQQLAQPKAIIEAELLKNSNGDFDEELLVYLIGTSNMKELKELDVLYSNEKGLSIADAFASRCKDNASLVRVVQALFRLPRDESKDCDEALAERQAEIIHKAGPARLIGVDEDTFFDVLLPASRAQCLAISEAYQRLFKMRLERAINMKFRGSLSRLLVLWTLPPSASIVTALQLMGQKLLADKNTVCAFLARYDKDTLRLVDAACRELQRKSLAELLSSALGGTQLRAAKGWTEAPSPDKGFERILTIYLEQKLAASDGLSLSQLLEEPEMINKLHFLLDKQAAELKLFLIDHKVKIDPGDQAILSRSSASIGHIGRSSNLSPTGNINAAASPQSTTALRDVQGKGHGEAVDDEEPVALRAAPPLKRKFSLLATAVDANDNDRDDSRQQAAAAAAEQRHQLVNHSYTYLLSVFEAADVEAEGSLEAELFWETARSLPLQALGFTVEEIDEVRASSAWEQEGRIFYYEALMEFAESCVTSILDKGSNGEGDNSNDVKEVIDSLIAQKEANEDRLGAYNQRSFHDSFDKLTMVTTSSRRKTVVTAVPSDFLHFVFDTITAFDLSLAGCLGPAEVTALIQTLNIGSLTEDLFKAKAVASGNWDGDSWTVDFKQASDVVVKEVQGWFTDNDQEHFICLIDKASGAYFWYNAKDGSTQWVEDGSSSSPVPATGSALPSNNGVAEQKQLINGDDVSNESPLEDKDASKADSSSVEVKASSPDNKDCDDCPSTSSKLAMSQSAPVILTQVESAEDKQGD